MGANADIDFVQTVTTMRPQQHACVLKDIDMIRLGYLLTFLFLSAPALGQGNSLSSQKVEVEKGVQLEVVDWGGSGQPLVFLAGFGGTARTFDGFAQQFIKTHRVFAITRRGFGESSHPEPTEANYTPERLALDVMTVLRRLGLKRPILVGHSIAGQELSEIGTRYPNEVAGLIYLEAAESHAFYGPRSRVVYPIAAEVRRSLAQLSTIQPSEARKLLPKLRSDLERLQEGLNWYEQALEDVPDRTVEDQSNPRMALQSAISNGIRIFTRIKVPILSIVAVPPKCETDCTSTNYLQRAADAAVQAEDFAALNPNARVVRIPNASHFIWKTNQQEVEREMKKFLAKNHPR